MQGEISPSVLAERIAHERELRGQTEVFVNQALSLQAREYDRRLTALAEQLDALQSWKDQLTGRLVAAAVALGIGFTLLGLFLDHAVVGS